MNPIEWLNRNLNTEDDEKLKVLKFIFLWQEYNFKYNLKNNGKIGDYKGALQLADYQNAKDIYDTMKNIFIDSFSKIPSFHSDNNPRTKLYADYAKEKTIKYDITHCSLRNFLELIYQIRCNFFHGGKMRENDDIDIQLIGWAYDCFNQLLDKLNYFQDG